MAILDYLRDREGERPLGVYALYNSHNDVQYVGYSRNMVLAVKVSPILFINSYTLKTAFVVFMHATAVGLTVHSRKHTHTCWTCMVLRHACKH